MSVLKPKLSQHRCTCEIIRQDVVVCKLNRMGPRVQAVASSYPFWFIVLVRWIGQKLFSLYSADEAALYKDSQDMPECSILGWPPSLMKLYTLSLLTLWLCSHEISVRKLIHPSEKVCSSSKGCLCWPLPGSNTFHPGSSFFPQIPSD